ncbi:scarecrow-like protein 8 [Salvia hispanica]|uniref:scarecrow-like protein 8 n=1 Tax=Salvia hispanica TaxID=49212 RepID=UPI002009D795|nr:scarecrow-like protein 8 [Salvia hispanica]
MSSGFPGGMPDSFTAGRRATLLPANMNNSYSSNIITAQQQFSLRSTQINGKRSVDEFHHQQQNLRNVRPRPSYQNPSPARYHLNLSNRNVGIRLAGDPGLDSEKNTMNHRLQELEKQLLDDEEDDGDTVSAITNTELSDTIQNLIGTSSSPTSSSSSCCSTSASPCPKQASIDAAASISEGKPEVAAEILTRLANANASGIAAHMLTALKSRLNPSENPPPPASELFSAEHAASTKSLYEFSPCFKLGIMAANLAILEAAAEDGYNKIHVLDFDVGHGGQYGHLLHSLGLGSNKSLKITAFSDDEKLKKAVGDNLQALANKIGVPFNFCVRNLNIADLNRQILEIQSDETLAVNLAFKLYRLPDESVTTENVRDELLRRVKGLSPKVMTVVEQELNTNTAPLTARVRDTYDFYAALLDSLDNSVRVLVEEGLGRKISNSVACDGRDRVERCEVFGKWRARISMAGFQPRPMSQHTVEALRSNLNSWTRGNAGFVINEESGGISFGWMARKLTVASAWR